MRQSRPNRRIVEAVSEFCLDSHSASSLQSHTRSVRPVAAPQYSQHRWSISLLSNSFPMAFQPSQSGVRAQQYQRSYPQQPQFDPHDDEYKANYDDLIDEYASPYAANARHQTYAVEAPSLTTPQHRRGPSFPLSSQKPQMSSKHSDDTSHDLSPVAYPPPAPLTVDTRGFWQKVKSTQPLLHPCSFSDISPDSARVYGM